jgi:hypothetical protein
VAGVQQDILVKIKVLLEGLGNVRALAGHVKDMGSGGGQVAALAGNIDQLTAAVDKLASAQEKSSKKGGFARFLTEAAAVVNILGGLPRAFEGVSKLLDLAEGIKGKVGPAFEKVSGLFSRAGEAAKSAFSSVSSSVSEFAGGAGEQAGAVLSEIGGTLAALGPVALAAAAALAVILAGVAALAAGFVGFAASVAIGAVALVAVGKQGLEAHRQLEQVQLGIAAIITSLAQVKVAGLPVDGAEKFSAAMALARDQVQKLRVDAINTTATFEQIAPAFQAALAPGLAAGLGLDQIREITVKVVQAAGALGIPFDQVNQEVRAILEGTINEDARLAKVLGISNKMVTSWKSQGTLADELNKRLEGFAIAGVAAADTLDGLVSNLQEALNVFSAEATTRAFSALKDEVRKLLPQLFDFKSAGIQEQFKSLTTLADDILVRVVRIGGSIAQDIVSGIKRAGEFVTANRETIDAILNLCAGVVQQLVEIARQFVGVATSAGTWRTALELVRGVLTAINVVLALVVAQLRDAAPLLRLLILAANAVAISSFPSLGAGAKSGALTADEVAAQAADQLEFAKGLMSTASASGAGKGEGKKTGGGEKSKVPELQRALDRAQIDKDLAEVQAKFDAVKQDIAASVDAIKGGLDDAILSISEAYRLEALLADKALKAEQDRIDAEVAAAQKRRDLAVKDLDPKLKPDERKLAVAAEDKKLATEIVKLEAERKRLVEETTDKKNALVRDEAKAQQALEDTVAGIENELDAMSRFGGVRAEAAAREIETRFRETRRQMVANFGEASEQVKKIDALIAGLSQHAKFKEISDDISTQFSQLRDLEELLSLGVEQGSIKAQDATKRRLELERELKRSLVDQIEGLAEIARRTGDPELLAAVRKLQIEWAKLGKQINETAKHLDETLRSGLEDTLTSIITRTKSVGQAFRDLAQTILNEIARILAAKFVEKLFGGLLNTGSGSSIGDILAKILGVSNPKPSGTPKPAGSGIENLPLIIKNFQNGAVSGLGQVNQTTKGVGDITSQGFGQMVGLTSQSIGLLGSIANNSKVQTASAVFATVLTAAKIFATKGGAHAAGGFISGPGSGTSDSILARLSNGEFIVREWAARRIGAPVLNFLNNFGRLPDLFRSLPDVTGFALGGFAGSLPSPDPSAAGGLTIEQHFHNNYQVMDGKLTQSSRQAMERDAARVTRRGAQRSIASNK